jgi:hypothetical protein
MHILNAAQQLKSVSAPKTETATAARLGRTGWYSSAPSRCYVSTLFAPGNAVSGQTIIRFVSRAGDIVPRPRCNWLNRELPIIRSRMTNSVHIFAKNFE